MNRNLRDRMMAVMTEVIEQMNTVHAKDFEYLARSRERLERQRAALAQLRNAGMALSASTVSTTRN